RQPIVDGHRPLGNDRRLMGSCARGSELPDRFLRWKAPTHPGASTCLPGGLGRMRYQPTRDRVLRSVRRSGALHSELWLPDPYGLATSSWSELDPPKPVGFPWV